MNILKAIKATLRNIIDTHQKSQVMRALREMSNTQLEDIGISRHQLERGVGAYPWRDAPIAAAKKPQAPKAPVIQLHPTAPAIPAMGSAANTADTKQAA